MPPSLPPDQRARRCPPSPVPVTSAQAAHDKPHRPPRRRTTPLSPPAPHHDRENAALLAAASSASTLGCSRNGAISGYGRAGGTTAGRSDRDHRDPRPRDREGPPRPGRPQASRSRQRDRDIRDRRFAEATAPTTAMVTSTVVHVAFWLADANHPSHASAPVRTRTNATSEQAHAELLPGPPAAHPGSTGTIILRSSKLRVLHGRLRSVTSRDEPGLIGPASRRTGTPARARHHQSR